jgi:two-component system, NarL family, response regulator NreC
MESKLLLGIIEDQLLFRQGMKALVTNWPPIEVIFESGDGYSVVEKLHALPQLPHVLLVDLSLPPKGETEFNGIHVTRDVTKSFPAIKILILSIHKEESFIAELIEQGAHGYLVKDSDPQEVRDAIFSVHTKGSYINKRTLSAIQNNMGKKKRLKEQRPGTANLTKREEEILSLICRQLTTEEIAEKLFISMKTVNGHRINLLQKTGAKNTAGLVMYALKNNIVML